ncbi:MAG: polyphosphate polymerase domain-containing protein [Actinomycetia bacterium]|nr:polyphosphate polymerase domain-containing protein [Actinomycetes bacterium]MCP4957755.1 polyphosphate polymerase domain-containing protein [Actinomycetes bacterium]
MPHRPIERSVAGLTPIDLNTLNTLAYLQTRTDRKYLLTIDEAEELVDRFSGSCAALEIERTRSFRYETTYFDTPDYMFHKATAYRRPLRYKLRVRRYLDTDLNMFEIKAKDRRNRTDKRRTEIASPVQPLTDPAVRSLLSVHRPDAPTADLVASLTTRFRRATLVGRDASAFDPTTDTEADFRVTIDSDVHFDSADGRTIDFGRVVLESKSSTKACTVDRWLWSRGIRETPISKYCTPMAAFHPNLPSNHWHRTLARFF